VDPTVWNFDERSANAGVTFRAGIFVFGAATCRANWRRTDRRSRRVASHWDDGMRHTESRGGTSRPDRAMRKRDLADRRVTVR